MPATSKVNSRTGEPDRSHRLAKEMAEYKGDYGTTIIVRQFGARLQRILGYSPNRNAALLEFQDKANLK